jgi:hypothetical protein
MINDWATSFWPLISATWSWSVASNQLTVVPGQNPIVSHEVVVYVVRRVNKGVIILRTLHGDGIHLCPFRRARRNVVGSLALSPLCRWLYGDWDLHLQTAKLRHQLRSWLIGCFPRLRLVLGKMLWIRHTSNAVTSYISTN